MAAVLIAGAGAGIGIGIYYLARKSSSLTGCALSNSDGLHLQNERDQQTYALIGDTASIHTGERVRVSGKKKRDAAKNRQFLVEKVSKDYGQCKVLPATPATP